MSSFSQNADSGFGAFSKADDLKKRILYTLFILIIYRFGTYVPLPGIDLTALKEKNFIKFEIPSGPNLSIINPSIFFQRNIPTLFDCLIKI